MSLVGSLSFKVARILSGEEIIMKKGKKTFFRTGFLAGKLIGKFVIIDAIELTFS